MIAIPKTHDRLEAGIGQDVCKRGVEAFLAFLACPGAQTPVSGKHRLVIGWAEASRNPINPFRFL
jgi:hypothetical protein